MESSFLPHSTTKLQPSAAEQVWNYENTFKVNRAFEWGLVLLNLLCSKVAKSWSSGCMPALTSPFSTAQPLAQLCCSVWVNEIPRPLVTTSFYLIVVSRPVGRTACLIFRSHALFAFANDKNKMSSAPVRGMCFNSFVESVRTCDCCVG